MSLIKKNVLVQIDYDPHYGKVYVFDDHSGYMLACVPFEWVGSVEKDGLGKLFGRKLAFKHRG